MGKLHSPRVNPAEGNGKSLLCILYLEDLEWVTVTQNLLEDMQFISNINEAMN